MRLETLPVILGILFALAGLALVADAAIPDGALLRPERRHGPRPRRHLAGEAALGLGVACVGVALMGRDAWRYTTVAVLAAFILCAVGVALNWRYMRAMMLGGTAYLPEQAKPVAPGAQPSLAPTARPPAPPDGARSTGLNETRVAPSGGERRPDPRIEAR
jgi:hypothetical protein